MSPGRAASVAYLAVLAAAAIAAASSGPVRVGALVTLSGLLIMVPLWPVAAGKLSPAERGLKAPSLRDLATGVAAASLTLGAFHVVVQHGLWAVPPGPWRTLGGLALTRAVALHIVDVVLPEEVFFRGYLQPAWSDPERPYGRGLWAQALAFGLLHVVAFGGQVAALDRVLPGLLFGALRAYTGSVWAPALVHLAFNLYVYLA